MSFTSRIQGHYAQAATGELAYHGTSKTFKDEIGIKDCSKGNTYGDALYLTSNLDTARRFSKADKYAREVSFNSSSMVNHS